MSHPACSMQWVPDVGPDRGGAKCMCMCARTVCSLLRMLGARPPFESHWSLHTRPRVCTHLCQRARGGHQAPGRCRLQYQGGAVAFAPPLAAHDVLYAMTRAVQAKAGCSGQLAAVAVDPVAFSGCRSGGAGGLQAHIGYRGCIGSLSAGGWRVGIGWRVALFKRTIPRGST